MNDFLANKRGRDRNRVGMSAGVRQHVVESGYRYRAVPDEIVATLARPKIVVRSGNRITDHFVAGSKEECEFLEDGLMRFGIEVGLVDHGPPDDIARVDRLDLGSEDSPDRAAQGVRAGEDVTCHRACAVEMDGQPVR